MSNPVLPNPVLPNTGPPVSPRLLEDLPPPDFFDPVIEAYKKDVDVTLLVENLKRSTNERSLRFLAAMRTVFELRRAGRERRRKWGATP